jgi:hypothetical protein
MQTDPWGVSVLCDLNITSSPQSGVDANAGVWLESNVMLSSVTAERDAAADATPLSAAARTVFSLFSLLAYAMFSPCGTPCGILW